MPKSLDGTDLIKKHRRIYGILKMSLPECANYNVPEVEILQTKTKKALKKESPLSLVKRSYESFYETEI